MLPLVSSFILKPKLRDLISAKIFADGFINNIPAQLSVDDQIINTLENIPTTLYGDSISNEYFVKHIMTFSVILVLLCLSITYNYHVVFTPKPKKKKNRLKTLPMLEDYIGFIHFTKILFFATILILCKNIETAY